MPQTLVLASGSPRRRELIASLGIDFTVIKSDIPEAPQPDESPSDYALRLSREKAAAVLASLDRDGVVLAADTVVVLAADTLGVTVDPVQGGTLLEKPADRDEARAMLRRLRGRDHHVMTAFTLRDSSGQQRSELVKTTVTMREYPDDELEAYIVTGDSLDKAGGYAIQHNGFRPVARITGCYNNVVGLPLCAVKRALVAFGWTQIDAEASGCDCPVYRG